MGSSATPPWVTELRSRNRKVIRNVWSSTDSYFEGDDGDGSSTIGTNGMKNRVVDPASKEHMHSKTNRATTIATEKSSPMREDSSRFLDDDDDIKGKEQRNNNNVRTIEEESILEYGPGIVRKLRSRYQSLALRQYSSRPSLRRSASLENGLDTVESCTDVIKRESPSPTPFDDEYNRSDNTDKKKVGMTKSISMVDANEGPRKAPGPRGRSNLSERRDKMRRARSVDALHRTKHQEEILEKFKAVVLPKEEIVIIEVSKPRANLNGLGGFTNNSAYYLGSDTDKSYPTQLFISPKSTTGVAENQQSGIRTRSFISPEHELPPHDFVKLTARIFEKNQENLSINGCKKVGQALRLSKSNSSFGSSSTIEIAQSPPPPPSPTQQQQRGTVMAQGSPSMQQLAETRDKSPATGPSINNTNTTASSATMKSNAASHAHGLKQVGIIRPTVSHPTSPLNFTNGEKVAKINDNRPPVLSPVLSPSQHAYKTFLQNAQKPPLSPKPIFTSSPKPNVPANHQKAVRSNPAGTPTTATTSPAPAPAPRTLITDKPTIIIPSSEKSMLIVRNKESPSPVLSNNNSLTNGSINRTMSPVLPPERSLNNDFNTSASNRSVVVSPKPESDSLRSISPISPIDRETPSPTSIKRSQYSGPLKQVGNSFTIKSPQQSFENAPAQKISQLNGEIPKSIALTATEPQKSNKSVVVKSEEVKAKISTKDVKSDVKVPAPAPVAASVKKQDQDELGKSSQLRAHQKQKSNQGGNSSMVFNFTTRSAVPDYIEDDGLHHGRMTLAGTVTDESVDDVDAPTSYSSNRVGGDVKPIKFVGDNVIINGKSSIQKGPKSQKLNISFNEDATTTYEYPSELSLLAEDDASEKDMLGHKGPNVINTSGNGLGSYTSKLANNDYQLGNYVDTSNNKKVDSLKKNKENESELIEDYLKPDSETTTWSNEITADILF